MDVPKSETEEQQPSLVVMVDGEAAEQGTPPVTTTPPSPPPPSYTTSNSFFSSLPSFNRSSHNNSPVSSFGPTIAADRAEEFSRSWMARSLPRNMRRQINEAAQAAAAANRESVIELPARMTSGSPAPSSAVGTMIDIPTLTTIQQDTHQQQLNGSTSLGQRFKQSLPRFLKSTTSSSSNNNNHY
jgi:hypothetical protein